MGNISLQFDYAALDAEARVVVKQKTGEIRDRMKRAASDIVAIGERLTIVKGTLGFGTFGAWLRAEFDWAPSTALRMMRVSDTFKNANLANLEIAPSALYLLSDPSTPPEVRDEVIAAAVAGEKVTHADVKQRVEATRKPEPAPESLDEEVAETRAYLDATDPLLAKYGHDGSPAKKQLNIKRDGEDEDVPAVATLERPVQHAVTRANDPGTIVGVAARWSKNLHDVQVIFRGIGDNGGIAKLAGFWREDERRDYIDQLKSFRGLAGEIIQTLEKSCNSNKKKTA